MFLSLSCACQSDNANSLVRPTCGCYRLLPPQTPKLSACYWPLRYFIHKFGLLVFKSYLCWNDRYKNRSSLTGAARCSPRHSRYNTNNMVLQGARSASHEAVPCTSLCLESLSFVGSSGHPSASAISADPRVEKGWIRCDTRRACGAVADKRGGSSPRAILRVRST